MIVGLCYDLKEDYGFNNTDYTYCNFATEESISFVKATLEKCGYNVQLIGNHKKLYDQLKNNTFCCDIVFSTAEGIFSRNRESWIPVILEINHIPYVGMDAYGLSLTLDKVQTKLMARHLNIPTPNFYEIITADDIELKKDLLEYPFVVKPYREGDSMGVCLVEDKEQFIEKSTYLLKHYNQKLLCEEYLPQNEITVSVCEIDGIAKVLGMTETRSISGAILPIFSSEYKLIYGSQKIIPQVPESIKQKLELYSLNLFKYTECHDYCRYDFRLDKQGNPSLMEITPLAALGENASFLTGLRLNGIKPEFIFDAIIKNACKRYGLPPES